MPPFAHFKTNQVKYSQVIPWHKLSGDVTASQLLAAFRCQLKSVYFVSHTQQFLTLN